MTDHAVLDGQGFAGVELNPGQADASAFDAQTTQADGIVRPGGDGDADAARWHYHAGSADPVIDDADRLGDGQRAVACWIEHVDFAAGIGGRERGGKSSARRGKRAGVGVEAVAGHERARVLRLCSRKQAGERKTDGECSKNFKKRPPVEYISARVPHAASLSGGETAA